MNIPLEETAQEVVLSSFPWFPENIGSSVRAWKNHGHISSRVSVWMWMEVVTSSVSFLLHVDIGITLQVYQQSKKKWECCHWGLLVIKLSACVRKRYLKGLVILTGPKNPEETYFFSSRKDSPAVLEWFNSELGSSVKFVFIWSLVSQVPLFFPGKAVLVQMAGEAVPTSPVSRCMVEVMPTSKAVQSLRGHFWQRHVHTWQEFRLREKPPCLSAWGQGWRQHKPGLFFLFKAFNIPIMHSPRHAVQDVAVPLFLQLLDGDIIMLLSQMLRGLINYVYETLWDSQMKGGFGIVRCYYKKKRMILLLYVNG